MSTSSAKSGYSASSITRYSRTPPRPSYNGSAVTSPPSFFAGSTNSQTTNSSAYPWQNSGSLFPGQAPFDSVAAQGTPRGTPGPSFHFQQPIPHRDWNQPRTPVNTVAASWNPGGMACYPSPVYPNCTPEAWNAFLATWNAFISRNPRVLEAWNAFLVSNNLIYVAWNGLQGTASYNFPSTALQEDHSLSWAERTMSGREQ